MNNTIKARAWPWYLLITSGIWFWGGIWVLERLFS